jgi:hypothetical protein
VSLRSKRLVAVARSGGRTARREGGDELRPQAAGRHPSPSASCSIPDDKVSGADHEIAEQSRQAPLDQLITP